MAGGRSGSPGYRDGKCSVRRNATLKLMKLPFTLPETAAPRWAAVFACPERARSRTELRPEGLLPVPHVRRQPRPELIDQVGCLYYHGVEARGPTVCSRIRRR